MEYHGGRILNTGKPVPFFMAAATAKDGTAASPPPQPVCDAAIPMKNAPGRGVFPNLPAGAKPGKLEATGGAIPDDPAPYDPDRGRAPRHVRPDATDAALRATDDCRDRAA